MQAYRAASPRMIFDQMLLAFYAMVKVVVSSQRDHLKQSQVPAWPKS